MTGKVTLGLTILPRWRDWADMEAGSTSLEKYLATGLAMRLILLCF